MRYRGGNDRQVSLYVAALMITIFGGGMTLIIVRAITEVDFVSLSAAAS
jgi:hypothetical protein